MAVLQFIFYVVLIYLPPITVLSSLCPKECSICFRGFVFCLNGGLQELPLSIPHGSERLRFENHRFVNPILRRDNFTRYAASQSKIEKLWIRNCSVKGIEAFAFQALEHLTWLDLSNNDIRDLSLPAFAELRLSQLILDHNVNIQLTSTSFSGLSVEVLSLKYCRLKRVTFEMMRHLADAGMQQLLLQNNLIAVLSPDFDSILQRVTLVNLNENPFECSCKNLWLSKALNKKLTISGTAQMFASVSTQEKPNVTEYPTCSEPPFWKGRKLHHFSAFVDELLCSSPHLQSIEVHWLQRDHVQIGCQIQAPPQTQLEWSSFSRSLNELHSQSDPISVLTNTPIPTVSISPLHLNITETTVLCSAKEGEERVQAKFHLRWTNPRVERRLTPIQQETLTMNKNVASERESLDSGNYENFFLKPQFTWLEILCSIVGTAVGTLLLSSLVYIFHNNPNVCVQPNCSSNSLLSSCMECSFHPTKSEIISHQTKQNEWIPGMGCVQRRPELHVEITSPSNHRNSSCNSVIYDVPNDHVTNTLSTNIPCTAFIDYRTHHLLYE